MKSTTPSRSVFQKIDYAILTVVAWIFAFGSIVLMLAAFVLVMLIFVGCAKQDIVLADRDAPLFVSDTGLFQIRVSAWDEDLDTLVDLGWYDNDVLAGRTIASFDWDAYARRMRITVSQFEVEGQIDLDLLKKTLADLPQDKIIVIDPPTSYEREKFLAVCQRLRPDLEFQIR